MRNFFLFLLLINILAFVYQRWILQPEESVAPDFILQDVPPLTQVERTSTSAGVPAKPQAAPEVTKQPESAVPLPAPDLSAAVPVTVTPQTAISVARKCIRVGPFTREADMGAVQQELSRRGATVSRSTENGRVWQGYWVQTAAYSSRQAAEIARKSLISSAMPDAYIIEENNEYRVSLGVFRLRASAEAAVTQAQRRGLATRMVERFQPGANYWLIASMPANGIFPAGSLPNAPGQILRSESITCTD